MPDARRSILRRVTRPTLTGTTDAVPAVEPDEILLGTDLDLMDRWLAQADPNGYVLAYEQIERAVEHCYGRVCDESHDQTIPQRAATWQHERPLDEWRSALLWAGTGDPARTLR